MVDDLTESESGDDLLLQARGGRGLFGGGGGSSSRARSSSRDRDRDRDRDVDRDTQPLRMPAAGAPTDGMWAQPQPYPYPTQQQQVFGRPMTGVGPGPGFAPINAQAPVFAYYGLQSPIGLGLPPDGVAFAAFGPADPFTAGLNARRSWEAAPPLTRSSQRSLARTFTGPEVT